MVEQFSAVDIRQHEVELRFGLEAPLERDDERGGDSGENEPFVQGVCDLSLFCNLEGDDFNDRKKNWVGGRSGRKRTCALRIVLSA